MTSRTSQWLSGANVCVGDCAGLSVTDKLHLKSLITTAGGIVTYLVHPKARVRLLNFPFMEKYKLIPFQWTRSYIGSDNNNNNDHNNR